MLKQPVCRCSDSALLMSSAPRDLHNRIFGAKLAKRKDDASSVTEERYDDPGRVGQQ
jgi:hypothetical protein